ncbi:MAG TPA: sulfatase-like hydrolase/transferase, partial [bacterium]|nr:sulfatase-like hydrolase/transferase [bacterium]
MNRRDFLNALAAGTFAGCASTKASKTRATRKTSSRPNIVFLLNDHQLHYRHGWDSGPEIQRPNFRRLASQGADFSRAYTTCPLCAPARRTMLTGLMPHQHGQTTNAFAYPFDRETYLEHLRDSGYRSFYYGKWHAGPGTAHDFGCEGFSYPSYNNPYNKPEYAEYLRRRGLPEPLMIVEQTYNSAGVRPGERYPLDRKACLGAVTGVLETPDDTHEAFFLANLAVEKLQELATHPSDQPFSLRVDFWGPHQPHFPTRRFIEKYDTSQIPKYPSFDSDLSDKPEVYRQEGQRPTTDENGMLIYPNPIPWEVWQKGMGYIYAHCSLVDAAGGLILDALDALGLSDNTIVI